jgi:hypothetical protein
VRDLGDRIPAEQMRTSPQHTFSAEEKQQALEAVLTSQTFARADLLKKFLRYVCEMEQAGRADEITEYSIATKALGRPRSYSPAADSGVRGRAHDLRQKLEQFYELENPGTTLRIGLRKGSYTPLFYEAEPKFVTEPLILEPAHSPPSSPLRVPLKRRIPVRAWALNLVLAIVVALASRSFYLNRSRLSPIYEDFWGPLVHPGSEVLLCLATPPSLLIKPFPKTPDPDIFRALVPDNSAWFARLKIPNSGGQEYMYNSGDSPLFGDAEAAVCAAQVVSAAGATVDFLPENTLALAALRNRNLLLIGSTNYSQYAARVLRNTPFTISEDAGIGEEIIRERTGAADGKVFIPKRDQSRSLTVVYGLITVFPNQQVSDRNSRTIIVSGVTGAGAGAAMHFFAGVNGLSTLFERFKKDGLRQVPSSYQVVVRGSRDKAVAVGWELADYRVMAHPPVLK